MRVVGLGHKARQGKDTLARFMVIEAGRRGYYAKQYHFAAGVYSLAKRLGMKDKDPKVLQALGTDVMREINLATWVDDMLDNFNRDNPTLAIITDVRFPNEANFIKGYEFSLLVRVDRYNVTGSRFIADDRDPNHVSETALDSYRWPVVIQQRSLQEIADAAIKLVDMALYEVAE